MMMENFKIYGMLMVCLSLGGCGPKEVAEPIQASQEVFSASEDVPVIVSAPMETSAIEVTSEMETLMQESLKDYDKQVEELNRKEKAMRAQTESAQKSLKQSDETKAPNPIEKPRETVVNTEPLNKDKIKQDKSLESATE